MTSGDIAIIGVGMHPFGRHGSKSALHMGEEAVIAALQDAGASWNDVGTLWASSMEVKNPEAITGFLGLTGIPARSTFTGCASGGNVLAQAANSLRLGEADVAVAVGLDKHPRGAFSDHPSVSGLPDWYGDLGLFLTTHFFGMKINRYMHDYGISHETLARVAAKAFRNGSINPAAWRRTPMTPEEILASPVLNYPLRQFMYCGPDEGAAAAVLVRAEDAHRFSGQPIKLVASTLFSRRTGAFELLSPSLPIEQELSPTVYASRAAYEQAGVSPLDIDVIQLQDTDAGSEIIHMAENGFCEHGDQEKLIAEGATEISGSMPINTDGGLLANGEPVGASGLRQVFELVNQLRGRCGDRQVPDARLGYAQLYGAPGTAGVTILSA